MRLREIHAILSGIDFKGGKLTLGQNKLIENIDNFKLFISRIRNIPIYKEYINLIENSALFTTTSDYINVVSDSDRDSIFYISNYLTNSTEALSKTADSLIDRLKDETIAVKMRNTSDLQLIIDDMLILQKAISPLILHETIGGNLEIASWEAGSKWMNLYLGSILAVSMIASVSWSGAVVYKKIQEGQILSEYVKGLKIKNESLDEIKEKQSEAISELVSAEAKRIQVQFYNEDTDNENFERIKHSIKLFSDLIQNGTEIHPALTAPESVQNLFPDFSRLESIASQTKLIADKRSEETPK